MYYPKLHSAILLNATNYTLIDLDDAPPASIILQCRTAVDVYIANSPTPSQAYWTMKSGSSMMFDPEGRPFGAKRGADLVTNGTFATDPSVQWTYDADDWTWDNTDLNIDKDANGVTTLSQAACLATIGSIYEIAYTVSGYSTAGFTASFGGVNGVARAADGAFKDYVKATATTALTFTPADTSRFTLDTISVKELTGPMLFAKAASGTPYLEIFYLK